MTQKTPKNKKYQKHEPDPRYKKTPYKRKRRISPKTVKFAIALITGKMNISLYEYDCDIPTGRSLKGELTEFFD